MKIVELFKLCFPVDAIVLPGCALSEMLLSPHHRTQFLIYLVLIA